MNPIRPDWGDVPPNIGAFCTDRTGGISLAPYDDGSGSGQGGMNLGGYAGDDPAHVEQNRRRLVQMLPAAPLWLRQVHGTDVVDAAHRPVSGESVAADASITTAPGVVCAVTTADCLPVLFCDFAGRVVGAAHAGWRGLAAGVLQNTVASMRAAGAGDIMAWLGPAIGPKNFEVGRDVHSAFTDRDARAEPAFQKSTRAPDKYFADLYALARLALQDSGVRRIYGGIHCTVAEPRRFYSYRRDIRTGRMAALIWIDTAPVSFYSNQPNGGNDRK